MNARFLTTRDGAELAARFRGALSGDAAQALAAAADAQLVALGGPVPETLLARLRAAGSVIAHAPGTTLVATTRAMVMHALHGAPAEVAVAGGALLDAFARAAEPAPRLLARGRVHDLRDEAQVMGIVNVTPDSFYERVGSVEAAVAAAAAIAAAGGAFVDVGGQSYAGGNPRLDAGEESARVVPAVRAIAQADLGMTISVDTFTASVATSVLDAGAHLINDCSGLSDPALPAVVAQYGAGLVVMHLKGRLNVREPQTYRYRDVLAEIVDFLYERTERAIAGGVAREGIAVDPGLEFGKEPATDLEILDRFGELRALGYPIVLASSRKSFIGRVFELPASKLLVPSLATAAAGIAAGARIVRAHDVAETVQLATMLAAIAPSGRAGTRFAAAMPRTASGAGNSAAAEAV